MSFLSSIKEQKMQKNTNKPRKKFNIFDWYYKQGKGKDKADFNALKDPSTVNFFKLCWYKLNKLFNFFKLDCNEEYFSFNVSKYATENGFV